MVRIHDTRAGRTEEIAAGRALRMYVCGPDVRRRAHVGDLRACVLSDLIRRVLERRKVRVVACQGVDDLGVPAERAREHEEAFTADAAALNVRPPEYAPRVSESAEPVIGLIATLLEKGHAYTAADGSVFFAVRGFPAYGELSGGSAGAADAGPGDWALWEPADGETAWESPWGRGLPGPHTGCSALALRFLGPRIDVHTGGGDLLFPHHENVRAQSGAAAGHEVTRHWVHAGPVRSGGSAPPLLSEVTEAGLDPLAVRMAFLRRRYREPLDLTWEALRAADGMVRRWRARVAEWSESVSAPMATAYAERAESAFADDLDTPAALRVLRELELDASVAPGAKFETFLHLDSLLGLDLSSGIGKPPALPPGAGELLAARERAQEDGDAAAAERLRAELADLGVRVTDAPEGQIWR
ncbi:cysteine--tRNA ligase [Nonomuraea sp. NPDC049309]|uniref:CysS/YqeB C-terminal domain-containing protein n=1 Tax=Nonomuraea sp. NPDC049309 TaxID=3364350 RepID=UPI00372132A4